jgi:hypothetical protein
MGKCRCPVNRGPGSSSWNENPHPFAFTKPAEEILNSLVEYLSDILGGAH